jgi:hypothetical protein
MTDSNGDGLAWIQELDGLGPYLVAIFLLLFCLNLLVAPTIMTVSLLNEYLFHGLQVNGQVLDCEVRQPNPESHSIFADQINTKNSNATTQKWLVEVIYKASEHKYADNPSLKFRNPNAYETKDFVRRFVYTRSVDSQEEVPVLLPRGMIQPRSGCPKEVVERLLEEGWSRLKCRLWIGVVGGGLVLAILYASVREIRNMPEQQSRTNGWRVLLIFLAIAEAFSLLYCFDQFSKKKCRTFDACRPMITVQEGDRRRSERAWEASHGSRRRPADPFKIPLHEFAGHARATERSL